MAASGFCGPRSAMGARLPTPCKHWPPSSPRSSPACYRRRRQRANNEPPDPKECSNLSGRAGSARSARPNRAARRFELGLQRALLLVADDSDLDFPVFSSLSQRKGEIGPRTDGHGPHLRDDVAGFQARPRRRRIGRHGSHEPPFLRAKVVGQLRRQVFDSDPQAASRTDSAKLEVEVLEAFRQVAELIRVHRDVRAALRRRHNRDGSPSAIPNHRRADRPARCRFPHEARELLRASNALAIELHDDVPPSEPRLFRGAVSPDFVDDRAGLSLLTGPVCRFGVAYRHADLRARPALEHPERLLGSKWFRRGYESRGNRQSGEPVSDVCTFHGSSRCSFRQKRSTESWHPCQASPNGPWWIFATILPMPRARTRGGNSHSKTDSVQKLEKQ